MYVGEELLLITTSDFQSRVDQTFQQIQNDPGVKQLWLQNPVETFAKGLLSEDEFEPQFVSDSNRLFFSCLANDNFRNWLANYQNSVISQAQANNTYILDRGKMLQDIAQAMITNGDQNIMFSLLAFQSPNLGNQVESIGFVGKQKFWKVKTVFAIAYGVVLVAVLAIGVAVFGIKKDPVGSPFNAAGLTSAQLQALADQLIAEAKSLSTAGSLIDPNAKCT